MNLKSLCGIFIRVIISVVFAGIFYTGWLAVALTAFKSGPDSLIFKAVIWLAAPVVTAAGFTAGLVIFELFFRTGGKSKLLNIYKWSLIGCATGAGAVVVFGPMLIVFGMFAAGAAAITLREYLRIKRQTQG